MDYDIIFLMVLGLLAAVVIAALLGCIAFFQVRSLRRQQQTLREEVLALRAQFGAGPSTAETAAREEPASQTVQAQSITDEPSRAVPPPLPSVASAVVPPVSPSTPRADPASAKPAKHRLDAESTIGGKLTIWIGGLALAFGGLFLVLYAVENALLGPAARIALGLVFGAVLAAAGEWTRRRPQSYTLAGFERANIPAILTSVGIFTMFAAVYAAHALYDLLGPLAAFAILAVLSLCVMALSLVHGPALGALGLVASYAVPFLVASNAESVVGLALYVLAVSLAALAVARLRGWLWLAQGALAALFFFGVVMQIMPAQDPPLVLSLYIAATFALTFATFVLSVHQPGDGGPGAPATDWLATRALAVMPLSIVMHFHVGQPLVLEVIEMLALLAVPMLIAYRYPALRFILVLPAFAACLRYLTMSLPALEVPLATLYGPSLLSMEIRAGVPVYAAIGALAAFGLIGWSSWAALRSATRTLMVATAAFAALFLLFIAYGRIAQFFPAAQFTFAALMLFALFHIQANLLHRQVPLDGYGRDASIASALIGSLVALAFAASVLFKGVGLTLALGLIAGASVITYQRYPLKGLRVFAVLAVLPYAARLAWHPLIDPALLAVSPPVFNVLALGYGLPALSFVACAFALTRTEKDIWAELMQGIAILACLAALVVLGLHAIDPTFAFSDWASRFAGAATLTMIGGAFGIALTRLTARDPAMRVLSAGAQIAGLVGIAVGAATLLLALNPVLSAVGAVKGATDVGEGLFVNLIGYGYGLPALVFGVLAREAWGKRHPAYTYAALVFAALLAFAWVNLTIRQMFSPGDLRLLPVEQSELYSYSVVWLLIGIAMLAGGILRRNTALRAASGLVLVAVVLKVFLLDLAHLTGILRAVSFIGLGGVLLAIGLVYQRALRRGMVARSGEDSPAQSSS